MAFYIEKVILYNRAPFDHVELNFSAGDISVLSAINGGGKTTIISHIVDAWYEMTKIAFSSEYEGKSNKFYRVSSSLFSMDNTAPSLFYIRFAADGKNIDYIDLRGACTKELYEQITKNLKSPISFDSIDKSLQRQNLVKKCSVTEEKELSSIFENNIATFFPPYRYETPGYLNDPYIIELNFALKSHYSGRLINPIEVSNGLSHLVNWIMDLVIDLYVYDKITPYRDRYNELGQVFKEMLNPKFHEAVRLGLSTRHQSGSRIGVFSSAENKNLYPSIFNMSSGEHALICIFVELIRQFDRINPVGALSKASGIVLIDEVDKHLHIKLQKEVLPSLFNLFPNIQFIISTHSPFVSMGLAEQAQTRTKVIALEQGGLSINVETDELYQEVYEMMVNENNRYKERYEKMKSGSKNYQLFVEDTYSQIYKIAWMKLNGIEFDKNNIETKFNESSPFEIFDNNSCTGVAGLLNAQSVDAYRDKKIIGLFDYDYEGSERFYNLKDGFDKNDIQGLINTGFYKQKYTSKHPCMYGLLLPVPKRLNHLIASGGNWHSDCKFANYVEVETLLPETYLSARDTEYSKECFAGFNYFKAKDKKKTDLWKALVDEPKETFDDFQPLFTKITELFGIVTSESLSKDESIC